MSFLKIKTSESFSFKILAELLQNCIKEAAFVVTKQGIHLRCVDKRSSNGLGTILINLDLSANNFPIYKLNTDRFVLGMNLLHFYKMLKHVKKKDSLCLEIDEATPRDLSIIVQQGSDSECNAMKSTIQVTHAQLTEIGIPEGYNKPVVCPSKDFAKIKNFNKVGTHTTMTCTKGQIQLSCSKEGMMSKSITFGEKDMDSNIEPFVQVFETENLTQLIKLSGLSTNVQIFVHPELPLKIKVSMGSVGQIDIFLKSLQQLEAEKEDDDKPDLANELDN